MQTYTSAVDIWSLGCILAELLTMQEGNTPSYEDRKPLFPGGSCYPLSADRDGMKSDERLDQLSVIFSVIGTPSQEDLDAVGGDKAYFAKLGNMPPKSFSTLFPSADPAALHLLERMLAFNPSKRCTTDEALNHEFFSSVRRSELEHTASSPLLVPAFLEASKIEVGTVKQKVFDEVRWYQNRTIQYD